MATGVAIGGYHRAHEAGAAGFGLYIPAGAYLGPVPMPASGYQTNMFPYVALVESVPAPAPSFLTGLGFGSVSVGTYSDQALLVTNCGTLPLTISSVSAAASVFTVRATQNGCTQAIPVGQSCTLFVRYTPTAVETDNSALTLVADACVAQAVLPLSGSGVVAKLVE